MKTIEMNIKTIVIILKLLNNFKEEIIIIENNILQKNNDIKNFFEYKIFFSIVNDNNIEIIKLCKIIESRDMEFFEMVITIIMDVFIIINNNSMLNYLNLTLENSEKNENENDYLIISNTTKIIYNFHKYCHQIKSHIICNIYKKDDNIFINFDLP